MFISMHSVLRFYICISHFMYMPMILVNLIVFEREKGSESSKFYEIFLTQIFLTHCVLLLYIFYSIFVPFMYMPMTLNASERESRCLALGRRHWKSAGVGAFNRL